MTVAANPASIPAPNSHSHPNPAAPQVPGLAPDSPAARSAADWRLIMLAPAALLLQAAHPVIGSALVDYSVFRTDPFGRFDRSYWATLALAFYGEEAADYGRDIRALHKSMGGTDQQGRRYHAYDPEAYFFVLATGYWASTVVAEKFGSGLSRSEKEELYAGWRQMTLLAGLRERDAPATLDEFEPWFDQVLTERLENHPSVEHLFDTLRHPPAPAWIPGLLWKPIMWGVVGPLGVWINTGALPPQVRELFGRSWTDRDEQLMRWWVRLIKATHLLLPPPIKKITRVVALRRKNAIMKSVRHRVITPAA
ncbi:oxygenase MpaB family protein [Nocardia sp. NPDC046763]|uniref:oxygenase MpaB family protein n=1 Tax=Nocardia sp. NPDC046763 TaxID=3155256 RepID=UPI00340E3B27